TTPRHPFACEITVLLRLRCNPVAVSDTVTPHTVTPRRRCRVAPTCPSVRPLSARARAGRDPPHARTVKRRRIVRQSQASKNAPLLRYEARLHRPGGVA